MKRTFLFCFACLLVTSLPVFAGDINGTINFKNVDVSAILSIYQKMSGLELIIDSRAKTVSANINLQAQVSTRAEGMKDIETALIAQAGIVITHLDDKRASVTFNDALPITRVVEPQTADGDLLDQFVANLTTNTLWMNGVFSTTDLPSTTPVELILKLALEKDQPNIGQVTNYTILKTRQVHFSSSNDERTAALVQTNVGKKIVLFKYRGPAIGWWMRVYDAKTST
jgi:type II secretory pathway component GspD/PulD (secretin)